MALPVVVGALYSPRGETFKLLILFCIAVGLWELMKLGALEDRERRFGVTLGIFHSVFLLFFPLTPEKILLEGGLLLIVVFAFFLRFHGELGDVGRRLGLVVLGIVYLGTLGSLVGLLRDVPHGRAWLLQLFAMTWLNDTFAYFVGHRWGRRRLAPIVSSGKTQEGFWGGLVGSLVGFLLVRQLVGPTLPLGAGLLLVLLVGLVGPAGDLAESLLKRGFGVKDSGGIFPGHGGMLDRIDSLLFAAPVVYGFALRFG